MIVGSDIWLPRSRPERARETTSFSADHERSRGQRVGVVDGRRDQPAAPQRHRDPEVHVLAGSKRPST